MPHEEIVKIILQKGLGNVNISMFKEEEQKEILRQVAGHYLRQGKIAEMLKILEDIDIKKYLEIIEPIAKHCLDQGEFDKAALIYEKIDKEMAEIIRKNLL